MLRWLQLGVTLLAAAACRPPVEASVPPDVSRAEDAKSLPPFDVAEGEASDGQERFYVEVGDAPTKGPRDAEVTIVMFTDFECPFCLKGHQTVKTLMKRYPGKIRFAYKAFPLDMHAAALLAAMAARTAQAQGKFWAFHDLLFSQRGLDPEQVFAHAKAVGLDLGQLVKDLDTLEYGPEVGRDIRQARRLGVHSTPTFFVNGRELSGAKPLGDFVAVVEEELELVGKLTENGTPADKIYDTAIADGYRRVEYARRGRIDPDGVFAVPLDDSPRRGPETAPVTIVVFGDFQCPFCARGNETLEQLRRHYGDKLRFVYKHNPLPFHSNAHVAARAALAAQAQGRFWAFHDALYERRADFEMDDLFQIARRVGLNRKKFDQAMSTADLDDRIEMDLALAASLGVTGTPAFFINGRPIEGAVPELQFRLVIEEELERAAAAQARGVTPGSLYDELTHLPLEP